MFFTALNRDLRLNSRGQPIVAVLETSQEDADETPAARESCSKTINDVGMR